MPKVVNKFERKIMIGFAIAVDIVQAGLDATAFGEIANHFIDIGVAAVLWGYGQWRGLWTTQKLLVLAATFIAEEIPFLNACPFWIGDVFNLYSGTIDEEEAAARVTQQYLASNARVARYRTGPNGEVERVPENELQQSSSKTNKYGYRAPSPQPQAKPPRIPLADIKPQSAP